MAWQRGVSCFSVELPRVACSSPQPLQGPALVFLDRTGAALLDINPLCKPEEGSLEVCHFRDRAADCSASFLSPKITRERIGTIGGAGAQALWICSLQSLGGAEDCALSSPDAPIPSDETAQALKDTLGSHAGLPSWDRVGREDKMSLSSQAPTGRKASPLMGFQRDLQIFVGRRVGSAHGKALQAGEESAGKIRTGCVLGGKLCRDKLWGQKCDQIFPLL